MEPKLPSPEKMPNLPADSREFPIPQPERIPELSPEYSPEQSVERASEHHHAVTAAGAATPIALPTPVQPQVDDTSAQSATSDDLPLTAADDDLIEKEWVDKAKKIVADTRDDPHMREKEVGKLQADYLRKRYGKELGETSE